MKLLDQEYKFWFFDYRTALDKLICEFHDDAGRDRLFIVEKPGLVEINIDFYDEDHVLCYFVISYKWPKNQPETPQELKQALEEIDFNEVEVLGFKSREVFEAALLPGSPNDSNIDAEDHEKLGKILKSCFGTIPPIQLKALQTLSRVVKLWMRYQPK